MWFNNYVKVIFNFILILNSILKMSIDLSTIIRFRFEGNTFHVDVEPKINSESKYRPSVNKEITLTFIAIINSLFHLTNNSLQNQIKKNKLIYKGFLLIFLLSIFISIIIYIIWK